MTQKWFLVLTRGWGQYPCNRLEAQEEEYIILKNKTNTKQPNKNNNFLPSPNARPLREPKKLNLRNRSKTLNNYVCT